MDKYKFMGIVFCFLFVYTAYAGFVRLKPYKDGAIVNVLVTDKWIGGGVNTFWVEFNYKGKIFSRKSSRTYYEKIKIGQVSKFKHIEGSKYFLFEKENPQDRIFFSFFWLLIGLFFIFFNFKKIKIGDWLLEKIKPKQ